MTIDRPSVPKNTTPTWEVELLLSGALVFAAMQAPALMDRAYFEWTPRLGEWVETTSAMIFLYAKVVAYALIGTFSVHLAMRAIWVALLGMHSVYPEGIDFEKFKKTPLLHDDLRRRLSSADDAIERADNAASFVFAFGMLLVTISLAIMLVVVVLVLAANLLSWSILGAEAPASWVLVALCVLLLPVIVVGFLDRWLAARLPPGHWLARIILLGYRMNTWMTAGWFSSYLMQVTISRLGNVRGNLMMIAVLYSLIAIAVIEIGVKSERFALPGESLLPADAGERDIQRNAYRSLDDPADPLRPVPNIQAPVVRGAYVELFIPHIQARNRDDFARACPTLSRPEDNDDATIARAAERDYSSAFLDCAQRIYGLTLNDEKVTPPFDLTRNRVGQRGFWAMIDVRALPPGRHVLSIERPQDPAAAVPAEPWRIVFWR